jgi:hypothetical protein
VLGIGVDDGNAVGRQQLGKEPQLGRQIGLHARVVVEVVAAEIAEGGGPQAHAVEPVLVEAVRGGLQGQMRNALGRQLRQRLVQGHRVGRGERPVYAAIRLDEAQRAQRGRCVAETGEDLPGEIGNRRLAAGACDGDDGGRLGRIEAGGHQGQCPARLRRGEHSHVPRCVDLRPILGQDRNGALRNCLRDEARTVGLAAGNGGKQPAGLYLAAVGGDAGYVDAAAPAWRRRLGTQQ